MIEHGAPGRLIECLLALIRATDGRRRQKLRKASQASLVTRISYAKSELGLFGEFEVDLAESRDGIRVQRVVDLEGTSLRDVDRCVRLVVPVEHAGNPVEAAGIVGLDLELLAEAFVAVGEECIHTRDRTGILIEDVLVAR